MEEGYAAVQVGLLEKKAKASSSPEKGHAKKVNSLGFYHYEEFRLNSEKALEGIELGGVLSAGFLKPGDCVDLTAVSKGKGFAGVMKRHKFAGGPGGHGSMFNRAHGSICSNSTANRVFKGQRMPGQHGNVRVTVRNVAVAQVDTKNNLLLVGGAVPGAMNGFVLVRSPKKP